MRDPDDALESEPTLDDVLAEPMVRAVMSRDRVEAEDLRGLLLRVRTQQTRRPPGEAKAAAAHEWMTSLHERGRAMGLRYSARTTVIER
ncbi:MAG TPA: hypothetical protein VJN67_10445 [Stellaceae bacterium]|nr:hypothetical protein [Stellaceae bacterium]